MADEPSSAISVRIESRSLKAAEGQRRHDLRRGPQPSYVDLYRTSLNTVILEPRPASVLRRLCEDRRATRRTQRAMRSDAAVATHLIVTFGRAAEPVFAALPIEVQDRAMRAVSDRVASELGVEITGLVVHRDESAIHAHAQMPAVRPDGRPISKAMSRAIGARLRDVAAEEIAAFASQIVRGERRADRVARGEDASRIVHRSVKELHEDLPRELDAARTRVQEMTERVSKLEAKAQLTAAEAKRLEVYQRRLEDRQRDLSEAEARLQDIRRAADRAADLRDEDEAASAEALDLVRQDAPRIVAEAHRKAQEEAYAIREAARADGLAQGRMEAAQELRDVRREIRDVRQGLFGWLDGFRDRSRRDKGAVWVQRLDAVLGRLRVIAGGSGSVGLREDPAHEPSEEAGPRLG